MAGGFRKQRRAPGGFRNGSHGFRQKLLVNRREAMQNHGPEPSPSPPSADSFGPLRLLVWQAHAVLATSTRLLLTCPPQRTARRLPLELLERTLERCWRAPYVSGDSPCSGIAGDRFTIADRLL